MVVTCVWAELRLHSERLVLVTSSWLPFLGVSDLFLPPQSLLELHKRRKALTEPEARYYLRQIVLGCQYLHRNQVIHRDLKLGNLFLNEDLEVKIGEMLGLRMPGASTGGGKEGKAGKWRYYPLESPLVRKWKVCVCVCVTFSLPFLDALVFFVPQLSSF